jgi:hypothetical protein
MLLAARVQRCRRNAVRADERPLNTATAEGVAAGCRTKRVPAPMVAGASPVSPGAVTAPAAGVGKPMLSAALRPTRRAHRRAAAQLPPVYSRAPWGSVWGSKVRGACALGTSGNQSCRADRAGGREKDSGHARQSSERARASACDGSHPLTTAAGPGPGPGRHSLGAGSSRGATRRRSARAASRRRRPSPDLRRKQTADRPYRRTPQRAVYPLNPQP